VHAYRLCANRSDLLHRHRGGQATLLVTPAGESVLIDAGYGPADGDQSTGRA
jgi:hypothetical protein